MTSGPQPSLCASVSFSITTLQQLFFDMFFDMPKHFKEMRDGKCQSACPIPSMLLALD